MLRKAVFSEGTLTQGLRRLVVSNMRAAKRNDFEKSPVHRADGLNGMRTALRERSMLS